MRDPEYQTDAQFTRHQKALRRIQARRKPLKIDARDGARRSRQNRGDRPRGARRLFARLTTDVKGRA